MESGGAAGKGRAQLLGDVGRQQPDAVGSAERRVREVHDAQVRTHGAQLRRNERELVVLHEHDVTFGRDRGRGRRERLVHRDVRVPCLTEAAVECRAAHPVEQVVEEEPEHAVGDDVVVQLVLVLVEIEQVQVDAEIVGLARFGRGDVVGAHRRRDPRVLHRRIQEQRPERAHDTARTAPGGEGAVVAEEEPVGAAVGDDDQRAALRSANSRSQSSSSHVERKLLRMVSRPVCPIASALPGLPSSSVQRAAACSTPSTR